VELAAKEEASRPRHRKATGEDHHNICSGCGEGAHPSHKPSASRLRPRGGLNVVLQCKSPQQLNRPLHKAGSLASGRGRTRRWNCPTATLQGQGTGVRVDASTRAQMGPEGILPPWSHQVTECECRLPGPANRLGTPHSSDHILGDSTGLPDTI
jgi:hypothetical protein